MSHIRIILQKSKAQLPEELMEMIEDQFYLLGGMYHYVSAYVRYLERCKARRFYNYGALGGELILHTYQNKFTNHVEKFIALHNIKPKIYKMIYNSIPYSDDLSKLIKLTAPNMVILFTEKNERLHATLPKYFNEKYFVKP